MVMKKCEICGATFIVNKASRKYCDDNCKAIATKRQKEERKEKQQQTVLIKKPKPNAELTEDGIAAKAVGMSYGQYRAWLDYGVKF